MKIKNNENSTFKNISFSKSRINQVNSRNLYFILCFIFILFILLFYKAIKKNINQTKNSPTQIQKDNENHDNELIEPYIKAQKNFVLIKINI